VSVSLPLPYPPNPIPKREKAYLWIPIPVKTCWSLKLSNSFRRILASDFRRASCRMMMLERSKERKAVMINDRRTCAQ